MFLIGKRARYASPLFKVDENNEIYYLNCDVREYVDICIGYDNFELVLSRDNKFQKIFKIFKKLVGFH
ncbi:MAG: hypothetical protein LBG67_03415 [Campylobacteraceae bacterium]|jgi:hypothetical protein|nr:hypothetical protein [Campylobacteraceae bacterium]